MIKTYAARPLDQNQNLEDIYKECRRLSDGFSVVGYDYPATAGGGWTECAAMVDHLVMRCFTIQTAFRCASVFEFPLETMSCILKQISF